MRLRIAKKIFYGYRRHRYSPSQQMRARVVSLRRYIRSLKSIPLGE